MERKIYKLFTLGIFSLVALLTFSCKKLIDVGQSNSEKNNSSKKAWLILNLENEYGRTVFASDADLADMTYTLVGKKSETTEVVPLASGMLYKNNKILPSDESDIELDEGTWDFTLSANKDGVAIYSDTVSNKKITGGENKISFTLIEISEAKGNGNVSFTLNFPTNSKVAKVQAELLTLEQVPVEDTEKEISVNENSVTYSQEVQNGIYILQFTFFTAKNKVSEPGYSEVVQVKAGRTSEATRDIAKVERFVYNPSATGNGRYADLDFIFNNQTLGTTTLKVKRSEWNQLLRNYDYFYKNENCVHGIKYTYEKDGKTWEVPNIGFRLRGNTSRFRPQGKDTPIDECGHIMPNGEWSKDYYNYAATCSDDDYRQSHFKVDFEEWLEDPEEFKMSSCMKGVALKRMDASCTREIMCYNLFRKNGIWTAPRASHTRVLFEFVEDVKDDGTLIEDIKDCEITKVDFGVYEMFEEVNKQSLKARDEENNKEEKYTNYWKNNKGNLWKCAGGDLTSTGASFGVEQNEITEFDENGNPTAYVWEQPTYDLKTNKDNLKSAEEEFKGFIRDLNALPKTADTEKDINEIKSFYEKWFDVEFFLKTYAINILCGMDDDYWANANNYYLYFDTGSAKATNKVYFIPFDYDNTLGNSIKAPGLLQNPLAWGRGANRPLIDRILLVPEYKAMFKKLLKEVSATDSAWNFEDCSAQFIAWGDMVRPYLNSPDIKGWPNISTLNWSGNGGYQNSQFALTYNPNIYDATRESFLRWLVELDSITFDLNGGNINGSTENVVIPKPDNAKELSALIATPKKAGYIFDGWTTERDGDDYANYPITENLYARWKELEEIKELRIYEYEDPSYNGIKIGILNIPENAGIRDVYINGQHRGDLGLDDGKPNPKAKQSVYAYPFTEAEKQYEIYVVFKDSNYNTIATTNTITITATSGEGEFVVTNKPHYKVENNILKFDVKPVLSIGSRPSISEEDYNKNNWQEYFGIELNTSSWDYQAWNNIGYTCVDYNIAGHISNRVTTDTSLKFCLFYMVASEYGNYRLDIYEYDDTVGIYLKNDPITFDLNGGNIDGNTDSITKTLPLMTKDISSDISEPKKAGFIFAGWTTEKDGDKYVKTSTDALAYGKLYAKWVSFEDLANEITDLFIYEIEDSSYDGFKIKILNKPYEVEKPYNGNENDENYYPDVFIRYIYVNNKIVSRNASYGERDQKVLNATEWAFPCTEKGKEYEVYIEYQKNWDGNTTIKSNTLKVQATSGKGEMYTKNKPKFTIDNNIITLNPVPELSLIPFKTDYRYVMELRKRNWSYQGDTWSYDPTKAFDFKEISGNAEPSDEMMFHLRFDYQDPDNPTYGHYWHMIYDNGADTYFTFE